MYLEEVDSAGSVNSGVLVGSTENGALGVLGRVKRRRDVNLEALGEDRVELGRRLKEVGRVPRLPRCQKRDGQGGITRSASVLQLGNPNNRGRAYLGKRVAVLPAVVLGLKVAVDGVGRGVLRAADGEGDARGSLGLDLERGGAEGEVLRKEVRRRLTNILRIRKERVRVIVRTSGSRSRRPADGATGRPREKSRAAEGQGRTRHETGTKAIVMKS